MVNEAWGDKAASKRHINFPNNGGNGIIATPIAS
jgi:hypothetical protein